MDASADRAELLQDFLAESGELLAELDTHLLALERTPRDQELLNAVFRGFHSIKGGAGFLGATELVKLCHLTENVLDRLRSERLSLDRDLMDLILLATAAVRAMLATLSTGREPAAAPAELTGALEASSSEPSPHRVSHGQPPSDTPATKAPPAERRPGESRSTKDASIRIDTSRLDDVLNVAGEIGRTKNRLVRLRRESPAEGADSRHLRALDETIGELDLLVTELQAAAMRLRMQPVGRLFQKYPRLARDLARELGKEVDVRLQGEATELDRNVLEALAEPLLHLVRNALDHGLETPEERDAAGKPRVGSIVLDARQSGGHVVIEIADDGRGIRPELLRRKALEKRLLDSDAVLGMNDRQAMRLVFLPGLSTKDHVSSVSGRGVGMDVVKTNIQRLNGRIDVASQSGAGTRITVVVPLTLAILPVLVVLAGETPFALPLPLVREIVALDSAASASGDATCLVRDEALPLRSLATLLGIEASRPPAYGVVLNTVTSQFVVAVDALVGHDEVVVKPIDGIQPKGVAGATLSADGAVVLVLDVEPLLPAAGVPQPRDLIASAA